MTKSEERRKYPRLRREERAVIRRVADADNDPVHTTLYCTTIDISATGLQALAKKELQSGDAVEVTIQVEGYGNSFHLRGETKWCRPLRGEGFYLLGVEIEDTNDTDFASWRRIFN